MAAKININLDPNSLERDWASVNFVNLEGVLPLVRGKVKNETVATFYDVYDVFDPEFGHLSTFRPD